MQSWQVSRHLSGIWCNRGFSWFYWTTICGDLEYVKLITQGKWINLHEEPHNQKAQNSRRNLGFGWGVCFTRVVGIRVGFEGSRGGGVVVVVVKGLIRQTKEFLDPSPLFKLRKCTFHGYRVVVRGWWGWTKWVKRVRKDKLPPIK